MGFIPKKEWDIIFLWSESHCKRKKKICHSYSRVQIFHFFSSGSILILLECNFTPREFREHLLHPLLKNEYIDFRHGKEFDDLFRNMQNDEKPFLFTVYFISFFYDKSNSSNGSWHILLTPPYICTHVPVDKCPNKKTFVDKLVGHGNRKFRSRFVREF